MHEFNQATYEKFGLKISSKRELLALIQEFKQKCGKTAQEKFEILDLRDKLLKLVRYEQEGNQTIKLKGTCKDMCPEKERYRREYLDLYHKYETRNGVVDHRCMIKEYDRSSADQDLPLPNEMRSSDVLMHTIYYILNEIIPQIDSPTLKDIADWYDFIWNRTRSMRKDIVQQRLNDQSSIDLHEICARWHIYCSHRLVDQPSGVFEFKINEENLKNCLQSLIEFYSNGNSSQQREAEFRAYMILINLHDDNVPRKLQRLKAHIRKSQEVKQAMSVYFAYNSKNYIRFFRLLSDPKLSYLSACIAHRFFVQMRIEAFKIIASAYRQDKEKCYPLVKLIDLLLFDDESDALVYCEQLNLEIIEESDGERFVSFMNFRHTAIEKQTIDHLRVRRSRKLVDSKFESSRCLLNEVISGGNLNQIFSRVLVPTSSFDSNGYYCADDVSELLEKISDQKLATQKTFFGSQFAGKQESKPLFGENFTLSSNVFGQMTASKSQDSKFFNSIVTSQKQSEPVKNLFASLAASSTQKLPTLLEETKIESQSNRESVMLKIHMENEIFESLIDEITKTDIIWYIQTLDKLSYELFNQMQGDLLSYVVEDQVRSVSYDVIDRARQETNMAYQQERQRLVLDITECESNNLLDEAIRDSLRFETMNALYQRNFIEKYSIDFYNDLYLEILANELNVMLNNNLVEIAQDFYINELYPYHLNEILRETIEEETKLSLKVTNNRLDEELNESVDLFKQKSIFQRWKNKMTKSKIISSSTTFYDFKSILFKNISNDSYLLHLCWLNFNYKYLINNCKINESTNTHMKFLFVMPNLRKLDSQSSDNEFIKRWLLSKFFQFDRSNSSYTTQIIYKLVTSFSRNHAVRFSLRLCPTDECDSEFEAKINKRVYYGSTSLIFVLLPLENTTKMDKYIGVQQKKLHKIVKHLFESENHSVKAKILFLSYLADENQTKIVIDKLINFKFSEQNVDFVQLDGQIVCDNQKIEEKFVKFFKHCYNSIGNIQEVCSNLDRISLFNVFYATIQVFLNYLMENRIEIPLLDFVNEYNNRIDILLEFLTKREYRELIWPLPEHTDFTNAQMLKYWNTSEIFDGCLIEFSQILKLDLKFYENIDKKSDLNSIKNLFHDYVNRNNTIASFDSVYTKICLIFDRLEITRSSIEWPSIICILINHTLQNGCILFKNKLIPLDKFYIYCNTNELKSFNWIDYNNLVERYPRARENQPKLEVLTELRAQNNVSLSPPLAIENRSKKKKIAHSKAIDDKFDNNYKRLISLLDTEKNESKVFDSRLSENKIELKRNKNQIKSEGESLKRKQRHHDDSDYNANNIDELLKSLGEEKYLQEKLNKRLNDTLNDFV